MIAGLARHVPRALLLLALALSLVGLSGCGRRPPTESQPPPLYHVHVTRDYPFYIFEGRAMTEDEVYSTLRQIADTHRRPVTGTAWAQVRIILEPRAEYRRHQELTGYCQQIGLTMTTR